MTADNGNPHPSEHNAIEVLYTVNGDRFHDDILESVDNTAVNNAPSPVGKQKLQEQWRKSSAAYRKRHPNAVRARTQNYRSGANSLREQQIDSVYEQQRGLCFWCGTETGSSYHVDHVIPLARGGDNTIENIVVSCPTCNATKGDRLPQVFLNLLVRRGAITKAEAAKRLDALKDRVLPSVAPETPEQEALSETDEIETEIAARVIEAHQVVQAYREKTTREIYRKFIIDPDTRVHEAEWFAQLDATIEFGNRAVDEYAAYLRSLVGSDTEPVSFATFYMDKNAGDAA